MHATRENNAVLDSNVHKLCCASNAGSGGVSQWKATHAVVPAMAEEKTSDWSIFGPLICPVVRVPVDTYSQILQHGFSAAFTLYPKNAPLFFAGLLYMMILTQKCGTLRLLRRNTERLQSCPEDSTSLEG